MAKYMVSIQGEDFGQSVKAFKSKSEAKRFARELSRDGNAFSDNRNKYELEKAGVMVYNELLEQEVSFYPFTKKYIRSVTA